MLIKHNVHQHAQTSTGAPSPRFLVRPMMEDPSSVMDGVELPI